MTANWSPKEYSITREEQTSLRSRATRKPSAPPSLFFEAQYCRSTVPQKKGDPIVIKYDESPREDTSLEALAK